MARAWCSSSLRWSPEMEKTTTRCGVSRRSGWWRCRARARAGATGACCRRRAGRRRSSVELGIEAWLREKFAEDVRETHKVKARRTTRKWRRFAYRGGRKWRLTVADRRNSGERLWRPGGEIGRGTRGQMERRARATYRARNGKV